MLTFQSAPLTHYTRHRFQTDILCIISFAAVISLWIEVDFMKFFLFQKFNHTCQDLLVAEYQFQCTEIPTLHKARVGKWGSVEDLFLAMLVDLFDEFVICLLDDLVVSKNKLRISCIKNFNFMPFFQFLGLLFQAKFYLAIKI